MGSAFERLAATLDYPLYVVTTALQSEPTGCLIGFATQCSIHPPRFLACISKKNHTLLPARRAACVAVHIVEEQDKKIAELFGGETGDEVDKFERCEWHEGPQGVPIVEACRNWFAGEILDRLDLGDHTGYLLSPIAAERGEPVDQFSFHRARRIDPGHEA